jgi:Acetyltransferase (GNAT) domain
MTPQLPPGYTLGPMHADEVSTLWEWARDEGWNPGLHDLSLVWQMQPEAFLALRDATGLAGGGTIFSYGTTFGFMGLFIVRTDLRHQGLGAALWHARRDALAARLDPNASIGMDGVTAMIPFYTRGGFASQYQSLRFEGHAPGRRDPALVAWDAVGLPALIDFDRAFVAADRTAFLTRWLTQPGVTTLVATDAAGITGVGVMRRCDEGVKVGPLHANTPAIAARILDHLIAEADGQRLQIDVPEPNAEGCALARERGLREVFGCTRMYRGPVPELPLAQIFGVTSFEFG